MAAITILGYRIFHAATGVAAHTIGLRVSARQRKAGFLGVIELGRGPTDRGVTLRAIVATRTGVHIVGRMTGHAAGGRVLVTIASMAGHTADLGMFIGQRETGLAMIKARIEPAGTAVT